MVRIGIPRALHGIQHYALWRTFFLMVTVLANWNVMLHAAEEGQQRDPGQVQNLEDVRVGELVGQRDADQVRERRHDRHRQRRLRRSRPRRRLAEHAARVAEDQALGRPEVQPDVVVRLDPDDPRQVVFTVLPGHGIVIAENGSVVELTPRGVGIVGSIPAGVTFVDGLGVGIGACGTLCGG